MSDALDDQIEAYETLLPTIKRTHGPVWVLIADKRLVKTFAAFPAAARYARRHFPKQQILIRHTEERSLETAPYVQVHTER